MGLFSKDFFIYLFLIIEYKLGFVYLVIHLFGLFGITSF